MASFQGRPPPAPILTGHPMLSCVTSLLLHLLLFRLQGDSPGPVQKSLHSPIVQVGMASLAARILPPPQPDPLP